MDWWSISLMGLIMDGRHLNNISDWKVSTIKTTSYRCTSEYNTTVWKRMEIKSGWVGCIIQSQWLLGYFIHDGPIRAMVWKMSPLFMRLGVSDSTQSMLWLLGWIASIIQSEWLSGCHSLGANRSNCLEHWKLELLYVWDCVSESTEFILFRTYKLLYHCQSKWCGGL